MKHLNLLTQIVALLLVISCNGRTEVKVVKVKMSEVKDSTNKPIPTPPPPLQKSLKVVAHLVYNDGSISSFDVLNDKSVALWNTIIGGGDALKPSTKVKLTLIGYEKDVVVRIKNGKRKAIESRLSNFVGEIERIIKDTGCEEVYVTVSSHEKILYSGKIPFHCGE